MPLKIAINPTHLSRDQSLLLAKFLAHCHQCGLQEIAQGESHAFSDGVQQYEILLTHTLSAYQTQNEWTQETDVKYVISNIDDKKDPNHDDVGAFGHVNEIVGVLSRDRFEGGLVFNKTFHPNTLKRIDSKKSSPESAIHEESMLRKAQIPVKPIMFRLDENKQPVSSSIVMRKFGKVSLFTILLNGIFHEQGKKEVYLTKAKLCKNMIRALHEQVHVNGLRHGDIKPENLMVDPDTLEIVYIDYGLASDENITKHCGTPGYAPDETKIELIRHRRAVESGGVYISDPNNYYDESSDFYSLALVMGLIWDHPDQQKLADFSQLFGLSESLRASLKQTIRRTFESMTLPVNQRSLRLTWEQAFNAFDEVEIKLLDLPENVRLVHQATEALNNQLFELAHIKQVNARLDPHALETVVTSILDVLKTIKNQSEFEEFKHTIRVNALKSASDVAAAEVTLNAISTTFQKNTEKLALSLDRVRQLLTYARSKKPNQSPEERDLEMKADRVGEKIFKLLRKKDKMTLDVDQVNEFNQICADRMHEMMQAYSELLIEIDPADLAKDQAKFLNLFIEFNKKNNVTEFRENCPYKYIGENGRIYFVYLRSPLNVIEPTKLTSQDEVLLDRFLARCEQNNIYEILQETIYRFTDTNGAKCCIQLTQTLTRADARNAWTGELAPSYVITTLNKNGLENKGQFGVVIPVREKLSHDQGRVIRRKTSSRVLKRQCVTRENPEKDIRAEYENLQRAGIKTKPLVGTNSDSMSIIMERAKGVNLAEFLKQHPNLTLDKKLRLSKNLIRALYETVHCRGLFHCDIKPENIMVDENLNVRFIDFGLASTRKEVRLCGTILYMAPEVAIQLHDSGGCDLTSHIYDESSDYYSLALVLARIWGGKGRDEKNCTAIELHLAAINNTEETFPGLSLSPVSIKKTLALMTAPLNKRNERLSWKQAFNAFHQMEDDCQLYLDVIPIRRVTEELNDDLFELSRVDQAGKPIHENAVAKIKTKMNAALEQINNSDQLQAFLQTVRVQAIKDAKSVKEIETKVNAIVEDFLKYTNQLLTMLADVESTLTALKLMQNKSADLLRNEKSLQQIAMDIAKNLRKAELCPINIDSMDAISKKYARNIDAIKRRCERTALSADGYKLVLEIRKCELAKQIARLESHAYVLQYFNQNFSIVIDEQRALMREVQSALANPVTDCATFKELIKGCDQAIIQCQQLINTDITKAYKDSNVSRSAQQLLDSYRVIEQRLGQEANAASDPVKELKNNIKEAIKLYIKATLNKKNVLKHDRAGSKHRRDEIENILSILQTKHTKEDIVSYVKNAKRWHTFFGSMLYEKIDKVIDAQRKNKPRP